MPNITTLNSAYATHVYKYPDVYLVHEALNEKSFGANRLLVGRQYILKQAEYKQNILLSMNLVTYNAFQTEIIEAN